MKIQLKVIILGFLMLKTYGTINAQINLSLEQALSMAREKNKSLQVQSLEEEYAKQGIKESKGNLLPSISLNGNYSYYFNKQVIFMPGTFLGNESKPVVDVAIGGRNVFNTMATIQQPIISEAARKQIKSSLLYGELQTNKTKITEEQLILNVATNYYTILLAQESIRLNQLSMDRNMRALEDSRLMLLQGKALKVDTLRNFIAVENLKTSLAYMDSNLEILLLDLKRLIGLSSDKTLVLNDSLLYESENRYFSAVETDYESVIKNRIDIQNQLLAIEYSKAVVKQTLAQRMPILSLVGSYQVQAQSDDLSFNSYKWPSTSYVGLQASVPIFTGNKINTRIKQASIRVQQQELEVQDSNELARKEIISWETKLKESIRRMDLQERTVEAAKHNYKIIADRYKNGLSSRLELSDADTSLNEASLNYMKSVYDIKITKLNLDKALGTLINGAN